MISINIFKYTRRLLQGLMALRISISTHLQDGDLRDFNDDAASPFPVLK